MPKTTTYMTQRVNVRLEPSDSIKLDEIREAIGSPTPSDTIRRLIREYHASTQELRRAARRLRKAQDRQTALFKGEPTT